jgi:hypothetical protein
MIHVDVPQMRFCDKCYVWISDGIGSQTVVHLNRDLPEAMGCEKFREHNARSGHGLTIR